MSDRAVLPEFALFGAIWRRRWLVVGLALVAAAAGALGHLTRPQQHEATAALMFRFEREYYPENPANDAWPGDSIRVELDEAIHTEMEMLGSRRRLADALAGAGGVEAWNAEAPTPLARMLATLGLGSAVPEGLQSLLGSAEAGDDAEAPPATAATLGAVRAALSLRRIEGTMVVDVTMRHPDPAFAERFVEALITGYLKERATLFGASPLQAMVAEENRARERLEDAEEALVAFRTEHGLFDLDRQRAALLDQLDAVRATLANDVEARIRSTKSFLERAESAGGDTAGAELTLAGLETERAALVAQQERLRGELADLESRAPALRARERTVELARGELERVAAVTHERTLETRLAAAAGPVISVIDGPARLPGAVGLSLPATTALAGVLGAILGMVVALWRELATADRRVPAVPRVDPAATRGRRTASSAGPVAPEPERGGPERAKPSFPAFGRR